MVTPIELEGVTVRKGGTDVLRGVDLTIEPGDVLGIVGSSGSGKTTLLRAIAGLDPVTDGWVRIGCLDVTTAPPAERGVAFVFQQPALYPKRSVGRNISFPLEVRHDPLDEIRQRVGAEARALHIESLLQMSPRALSAGEAQLVQIARAMVRAPDVLLLDEPFAHLDDGRASLIRRELSLIQRGFGVTTVIATNDALDAMAFSDRLAVIERGRITQIGAPLDIYEHPLTASAALMTGDADVIEIQVQTDVEGAWLVHPGFRIRAWAPALRRHAGRRLQLVVRPEWWHVDERGHIRATIDRVQRLGTATSLWCRVGGRPMTVKLAGSAYGSGPGRLREGDTIGLRLERYVLLDPIDGFELDLS